MTQKQYLTLEELREYLPDHPSKRTVYGWTSAGKIPFVKFGIKCLRFDKEMIDKWNELGRPDKDML